MSPEAQASSSLRRTLSTGQAVTIGVGSMVGAGVFVVWSPAAALTGTPGLLLLSLLLVTVVAACNAYSSAILGVRFPNAGGTYVYGTRCLGPLPGFLAGWCFVVGKTASCAAMALTLGLYVSPGDPRVAAAGAVLVLGVANALGAQRSASLSRVLVTLTLSVLAGLALSALWMAVAGRTGSPMTPAEAIGPGGAYGVLQAAGLLFFAFAGYARIATLAEEVRDPERTLPQAITVTFVVVAGVYAAVALLVLGTIGIEGAAATQTPLAAVADDVWDGEFGWVVQAAALCAATGALLNMLLGVSRVLLAMARDGHLPQPVARVSGPRRLPWVAEAAVTVTVLVVVLSVDVRGAIGFSSFGVLLYYAVTNLSAWTVRAGAWWQSAAPAIGLIGCLVLVAALPLTSVFGGALVVTLGIGWYAVTRRSRMAG
ncbi:MAG: APC family permease [Ornithinimicrobium sp.]